ncbi:hypothetical protein [Nostoc sp.]
MAFDAKQAKTELNAQATQPICQINLQPVRSPNQPSNSLCYHQ